METSIGAVSRVKVYADTTKLKQLIQSRLGPHNSHLLGD
jgi:hypothetical protein